MTTRLGIVPHYLFPICCAVASFCWTKCQHEKERITDIRYGSKSKSQKNEFAQMGTEHTAFELALRRSNHRATETPHLIHHIQLRYPCCQQRACCLTPLLQRSKTRKFFLFVEDQWKLIHKQTFLGIEKALREYLTRATTLIFGSLQSGNGNVVGSAMKMKLNVAVQVWGLDSFMFIRLEHRIANRRP